MQKKWNGRNCDVADGLRGIVWLSSESNIIAAADVLSPNSSHKLSICHYMYSVSIQSVNRFSRRESQLEQRGSALTPNVIHPAARLAVWQHEKLISGVHIPLRSNDTMDTARSTKSQRLWYRASLVTQPKFMIANTHHNSFS